MKEKDPIDAMEKQLIDELFSCKIPNYTPDGKLVLTILPDDKMEGFFR